MASSETHRGNVPIQVINPEYYIRVFIGISEENQSLPRASLDSLVKNGLAQKFRKEFEGARITTAPEEFVVGQEDFNHSDQIKNDEDMIRYLSASCLQAAMFDYDAHKSAVLN